MKQRALGVGRRALGRRGGGVAGFGGVRVGASLRVRQECLTHDGLASGFGASGHSGGCYVKSEVSFLLLTLQSGFATARGKRAGVTLQSGFATARGVKRGKRGGITLIELLIVMVMMIFIVMAVGTAYNYGATFNGKAQESRTRDSDRTAFEDRLRDLIGRIVLPASTDNSTYFIGTQGLPSALGSSSGLGTLPGGGVGETGGEADTLVFLVAGARMSSSLLASTDSFEDLNTRLGPQGGITEVSLSTTAVGEEGANRTGLFIREQRPFDGDPSQGGEERVLDADIETIKFEFWDGLEWQAVWDTRSQTGQRLPAVIRITFTLTSDTTETNHVLTIRVPASDVTAENPVTVGGAQ